MSLRSVVRFCFVVLAFAGFAFPQSPAPSGPSGKIAYVHNDALYLKTLPDGRPVEISRGATNPQFSRSGEWLSYVITGEHKEGVPARPQMLLVRWTGEGMGAILNFQGESEAFWSPSEDEIALTTPFGLTVVRPNRPGLPADQTVVLRAAEPNRVTSFRWSADGRRLAVILIASDGAHLWSVDAHGGPAEEVVVPPEAGQSPFDLKNAGLAGWSSDGQRIFMWPGARYSASLAADGLALFSVSVGQEPPQRTIKDDVLLYSDFISISPQRPELLITAGGNRDSWTNKHLLLLDPDSGKTSIVGDPKKASASVAWSPDGKQFVYSSGPDDPEASGGERAKTVLSQRHLWIADASGQRVRQLTNDFQYRDEYPLWSKDGRTLLFTRMDAKNIVSVWTVNADGSGLRRIADEIMGFPPPLQKDLWFSFYGHVWWPSFLAWSR